MLSTREFPREKLDIKKFIKGVVVCVYASMYVCVYKHWVVIKSNFGNHPWDYYITSFHTSCIFSTRSSAVYRSILQYEREILNHILVCPQKWTHKNTSNCYYIIFSPTVKVYLRKTAKLWIKVIKCSQLLKLVWTQKKVLNKNIYTANENHVVNNAVRENIFSVSNRDTLPYEN